jgi:hypothetical protein
MSLWVIRVPVELAAFPVMSAMPPIATEMVRAETDEKGQSRHFAPQKTASLLAVRHRGLVHRRDDW